MAKPIAVVYINMDGQNNVTEKLTKLTKVLMNDKPEYYWFVFPDSEIYRPELKVFYEKDFEDVKYNELKEIVINALSKYTNEKN